jgi:hypothetical protein
MACKGRFQSVKPLRGALNVGQAFVIVASHELEDSPRDEKSFELPQELFGVMLDDPIEIHDVAVTVVEAPPLLTPARFRGL